MLPAEHIKQETPEGEIEYFDLTSQLNDNSDYFETNGKQNTHHHSIDCAAFPYLVNNTHLKTEDYLTEKEFAYGINVESDKNVKCNFCNFITTGISELELHQQRHDPLNICRDECDFVTSEQSVLLKHKRNSHSKRTYKCYLCTYSASDTFRIKRHLNSHKIEREHACDTCNSRFKDKSTLRSHQKIHTNYKPHKCTLCDYASVRSTTLTLHLRTHTGEKPFACGYCSHTSAYHRHFKLHVMRVHYKMKPYRCDLCDYRSTESCQLKRHRRIHIPKELLVNEPVDKKYQCLECPFVTSRGSSLNRHNRIHTGDKPFVCFDCGHATAYKNHLKLHWMRAHLKLKPYPCSLCAYSTSTRSQLQRHTFAHTKNHLAAPKMPVSNEHQVDHVIKFLNINNE